MPLVIRADQIAYNCRTRTCPWTSQNWTYPVPYRSTLPISVLPNIDHGLPRCSRCPPLPQEIIVSAQRGRVLVRSEVPFEDGPNKVFYHLRCLLQLTHLPQSRIKQTQTHRHPSPRELPGNLPAAPLPQANIPARVCE